MLDDVFVMHTKYDVYFLFYFTTGRYLCLYFPRVLPTKLLVPRNWHNVLDIFGFIEI